MGSECGNLGKAVLFRPQSQCYNQDRQCYAQAIHLSCRPQLWLGTGSYSVTGKTKKPEIELRPDGWERFKTAVAAAAKSGPQHRPGKPKPKEPEAKKPNE